MIMLAISLYKALRSEHGIIQLEIQQLIIESSYREDTQKELEEKREAFEETLPDEQPPEVEAETKEDK